MKKRRTKIQKLRGELRKLRHVKAELRRWKGFATNLWRDAQAAAADLGDEEEMYEAHGIIAESLDLPCDFEPDYGDDDD